MTFEEAEALAEESVARLNLASDVELTLLQEQTVEVDEGWLFFYNSKEFVQTGNPIAALAGNGPILVDRNGRTRTLPSGVNWQGAIGPGFPNAK